MQILSSWRSHIGIIAVDHLHQDSARTVGNQFTEVILREVDRVSKMTNVNPQFLEKSPRYCGSRPFAPGTRLKSMEPMNSLSFWRRHSGIEDDQCTI